MLRVSATINGDIYDDVVRLMAIDDDVATICI